ncbi:MAG: hypothetical protein AABZ18_04995 [Pseudomonadota bacterium]
MATCIRHRNNLAVQDFNLQRHPVSERAKTDYVQFEAIMRNVRFLPFFLVAIEVVALKGGACRHNGY